MNLDDAKNEADNAIKEMKSSTPNWERIFYHLDNVAQIFDELNAPQIAVLIRAYAKHLPKGF